jgi:hydroxyacylglutathione hydrolase
MAPHHDRRDVFEAEGMTVDTFVTGRWHENCYVISDQQTGQAAVIDPGDDGERILRHLSEERLNPELILLTHSHYDHLGAAEAVCQASSRPCLVHTADHSLLKRAPLYALSFEKRALTVPRSVELFEDGASFSLGRLQIRASLGAGHTPGSVSFRCGSVMFTGDTLLRAKAGRTDLPGGDRAQLRLSIEALMDSSAALAALFPGHGHRWSPEDARAWWAANGQTP